MAKTSSGSRNSIHSVDIQLWHACAGGTTNLPEVGSVVIYFPQGHTEQAASPPPADLHGCSPAIACKVMDLAFLADTETDEAYARMCLQPLPNPWHENCFDDSLDETHLFPESKPATFAKTLTQSDANNGGGFSIPRFCAETIFPRLDYAQSPPVQTVLARDVHGKVWKFRHIYRGTPRRHLLTTGWSNFVNQKRLVAGDVIVFVRTTTGELCIGIRRSIRGTGHHRPPPKIGIKLDGEDVYNKAPPSLSRGLCIRNGSNLSRQKALFTAQAVMEAASAASSGQPFEIIYYPRAMLSDFCVKASAVKKSLQHSWTPGMRFKMAVETDDASRTSWYMGTIVTVDDADPIFWPNSPWKMLQVTWDEGTLQEGIGRVSPWQVDLVSPLLSPSLTLPKKKPRFLHTQDVHFHSQPSMARAIPSGMPGYTHWQEVRNDLYPSMEGARHGRDFGVAIQDSMGSSCPPSWLWNQPEDQHINGVSALGRNLINMLSPELQSNHNHQLMAVTVGSSANSEPALSSNVSCDEGGSSSPKCTRFLLFGKSIDISSPKKMEILQPPPNQDTIVGLANETSSDGFQSEVSLSAQGSSVEPLETTSLHLQQGESLIKLSPYSTGNTK